MTVEDSSVIDFVAHDPKSDVVSLVLVEHREWGDEGRLVPELRKKLKTYLAYVLDGQFARAYPQHVGKRLTFELRTAHPPGPGDQEFLSVVRTKDLEPKGIGLTWRQCQFPDDAPPESGSGGTSAKTSSE